VNLTDYLDTGLFLDDRLLRARIRAQSEGKRFLNLFAHTCAATVAAARGGARTTTSVDLSNTYLEWGRENLALNGSRGREHELLRTDVLSFVREARERRARRWDLVYLAPPTYSQSKAMHGDFDVQRDHVALLHDVAALVAPGGEILFTTNLRTFEIDTRRVDDLDVSEVTRDVTPVDFAKSPRVRAFSLRLR
jgi:23S rRNA (guanine2445-N2)-methyltransferase / 23S rRNA (guanine2069-N7)-methyltransferase